VSEAIDLTRDRIEGAQWHERVHVLGLRTALDVALAKILVLESENTRRSLDQADLREKLRSAEAQELLGVTREMTANAFVSRDLVERAWEVLGDEDLVLRDAVARARMLLAEGLGRP
jgi:hypothetical protein